MKAHVDLAAKRAVAILFVSATLALASACSQSNSSAPPAGGSPAAPTGGSSASPHGASPASSTGATRTIIMITGGPCSTNDYMDQFCQGVDQAKSDLAARGFDVQYRSGTDWGDLAGYSVLIQNAISTKPAAIAVFSTDPTATLPVLNQACEQGIKVVVTDQEMPDLTCQAATVAADWTQMGTLLADWLKANPVPGNKKYGVVGYSAGQLPAVKVAQDAFTTAADALGYDKVAEIGTPSGAQQDAIQSAVQNLLTANPDMSILFSSSDSFDIGLSQAMKAANRLDLVRLSIDGNPASVQRILDGTGMTADVAKSAFLEAYNSVTTSADAADGVAVPKFVPDPIAVIDATNVQAYIDDPVGFWKQN